MSTLPSTNPAGRAPRKQPITVYTVMLIVSSVALLIACILMYVEIQRYGEFPYWNTRDAQPSVSAMPASSPQGLAGVWHVPEHSDGRGGSLYRSA